MSHDLKNDDVRFEPVKVIGSDTPAVDANTWNAGAFGPHAPVCVLDTAKKLERDNAILRRQVEVLVRWADVASSAAEEVCCECPMESEGCGHNCRAALKQWSENEARKGATIPADNPCAGGGDVG